MSVWLCIPSKRAPEEAEKCLKLWRERGYKVILQREDSKDIVGMSACVVHIREYKGYSEAVNYLTQFVLKYDSECDWVVLGGDDVEPDANHSAEEIARECSEHFSDLWTSRLNERWKHSPLTQERAETYGVMQPTGDRWGDTPQSRAQFGEDRGAYCDRVCGSPWIGREFALRVNQGRGPLWPEYFHMYEDEELFHVAQKYGVLWQRRDLIHMHNHWGRARGRAEDMPEFLKRANSPEEWRKAKTLFDERKAKGFSGSEPL